MAPYRLSGVSLLLSSVAYQLLQLFMKMLQSQ